MNNQCPKGFICINNMNVLSIILLLVVCLYFFNRENNKILYDKIKDLNNETDNLKQSLNSDNRSNDRSYENNYEVYDRDLEAIRDPLYPPLKRNFHIDSKLQLRDVRDRREIPTNRVSRLGLPINIETRGPSEDYQQIGMLYNILSRILLRVERKEKLCWRNPQLRVVGVMGWLRGQCRE